MARKSVKALQPFDQARTVLAEIGLDLDAEMAALDEHTNGNGIPRVHIEHNKNGRHRMFIDLGEAYDPAIPSEIELENNQLNGVVVAFQQVRSIWQDGEPMPVCSAINDQPRVEKPLANSCKSCEHGVIGGTCKTKMRILLLTRIKEAISPVILMLPPTSLKHWSAHLRRLQRSNLPAIVVNTVFTLEDVKRNGFRWAEVVVNIDGITSREMLLEARRIREEYVEYLESISKKDFSDPGDTVDEEVGF